ncbi:MAG TPA: hypothetical protein VM145_00700 [Sphingomicrobium sp.]|nr:hypothetical protein [Sphingomicrobium sp.]
MSWRAAAAMLLLCACSPRDPQPPRVAADSGEIAAEPAVPALAPVTTLAGEWRVAGLDGREIAGSVGIALRGSTSEIWWDPRCAGFVRSYTIEGTRFSAGPYVGFKPRRPGEPTPPVCAIAPPPQMRPIFDALNAATVISRTANNGVKISGGGRSVLLFSQ